MPFANRLQAGELLAPRLAKYAKNAVVLGLPRGGVVTAYAIAKALKLPLDILCLRKIGAPGNPELAVGAISATGEAYYNQHLIDYLDVSQSYLAHKAAEERKRAQERLLVYRKSHREVLLEDKIAILVDDGLATGATMHAAIETVQAKNVSMIVVAVPVASPDSLSDIAAKVDAVVCLETPEFFHAVGIHYDNFDPVEDEEVIQLLRQSQQNK